MFEPCEYCTGCNALTVEARAKSPVGRATGLACKVPQRGAKGPRRHCALEEAGVIFTADGVKLSRNLRGGRVPEELNAEKDG